MDEIKDKELRKMLFVINDRINRIEILLEDVANSFALNTQNAGISMVGTTVCTKCSITPYEGYVCHQDGGCPHGFD